MSKVMLVYYEDMKEKYMVVKEDIHDFFCERGMTVEELGIRDSEQSQYYVERLQEKDNKYICSLDMAGFQLLTLLDTYLYNILHAKQLHLVIHDNIFPMFANGEFALNLFVYLPRCSKKWNEEYSHIPNLIEYPGILWPADDGAVDICYAHKRVLCDVLEDFLKRIYPNEIDKKKHKQLVL